MEMKILSVPHLRSLVKKGFKHYRLEAEVQPSMEVRSKDLFIPHPYGLNHSDNGENFAWDLAVMVLHDNGQKYKATVYCIGDFTGHDIIQYAKEFADGQER